MSPTRKRKRAVNKTTRKMKKRMQNVDTSAQSVQASQQALIENQKHSKAVLDHAAKQAAAGIRSGSKAVARMSEDPQVQKEFAITVEKVGDAVAAVAENS